MRIVLLNAEPDSAAPFQAYLDALAGRWAHRGHPVDALVLRDLDLKGCLGCWSCWVRTPGECARRDDSARVCRAVLNADLVVLASPLVLGFTSALAKGAADQMIPLLHPYLVLEGGEFHHRPRYARRPALALVLAPGADDDAEDLAITTSLWRRAARNLKLRLVASAVPDRPAPELADALVAAA